MAIDKNLVRRVLAKHYHPKPNEDGPSWLTLLGHNKDSLWSIDLCRMFNMAISMQGAPHYLSSDNDPLFRYHRWQANLRVLEISKIKYIPYTPVSHPLVERLTGTIRRESLDRVLFWNVQDLQRKLDGFLQYYNRTRVHQSLDGSAPAEDSGGHQPLPAKLSSYSWISDCNGLFQTPVAA